jgi:hypothetical protein
VCVSVCVLISISHFTQLTLSHSIPPCPIRTYCLFLSDMHSILSFFALDGEFRALAGGGVFPPIPPSIRAPKPGQNQGQESDTASQSQSNSKGKGKKGESDDKSGGKQYYGHPSAGLPRSLAFPLCQEYLLGNMKETINIANAPALRPHHHNKKSFYKHHHHHHEHVRYI